MTELVLIASLAGFSNAGMIPSRRLGNKNVKDIDVANSAGNKYSPHKRTRPYTVHCTVYTVQCTDSSHTYSILLIHYTVKKG
jgi:hypothetical protein